MNNFVRSTSKRRRVSAESREKPDGQADAVIAHHLADMTKPPIRIPTFIIEIIPNYNHGRIETTLLPLPDLVVIRIALDNMDTCCVDRTSNRLAFSKRGFLSTIPKSVVVTNPPPSVPALPRDPGVDVTTLFAPSPCGGQTVTLGLR